MLPTNSYSQDSLSYKKNQISINTGIVHQFFDGSEMINTNHLKSSIEPFSGILYNSIGVNYIRKFNKVEGVSCNLSTFQEHYFNVFEEKVEDQVFARIHLTLSLNYERQEDFKPRFSLNYGGGINYRRGSESLAVGYYNIGGYITEIQNETRRLDDLGLNIFTGIEYKPIKWLTFYSKINCIGFVYLNDHEAIDEFQNIYKIDRYPYRFDLSLRFGVGVAF